MTLILAADAWDLLVLLWMVLRGQWDEVDKETVSSLLANRSFTCFLEKMIPFCLLIANFPSLTEVPEFINCPFVDHSVFKRSFGNYSFRSFFEKCLLEQTGSLPFYKHLYSVYS